MSVEAMAWALHVPVAAGPKLTLLGLASHATAEFSDARPTIETLCAYGCCDRRTVQRHLRELEAAGWITPTGTHPLAGRPDRAVNVYALSGNGAGRQYAAPRADRGGTSVAIGAAPVPPDTSTNTSIEQPSVCARASASDEALFDPLDNVPSWAFNGKAVPLSVRRSALATLEAFNDEAGATLKPFRASGQVQPHLTTITGALLDHPEVSAETWRDTICRNLRVPWWQGAPSVGVIFGPKVVDRALACSGEPPKSKAQQREDQSLRDLRELHDKFSREEEEARRA